ncbi:FAD/NAD(P)-binding domain-containing protein [Periconia macrospinosa]|uniref:FAD/NAD(P)-binding domain-containing protein n=1 Tax=Periconia macrospinosa TaxID=97972 RepID=A0A2V1CZ76_9PLEO|nr:FAD/NAD(P)-binding domain-containing protein [Periconia macrospinosa]
MPLRILIVGAGVTGPAFASLLQRFSVTSAHHVTVIERSPDLRLSGQQIDFKAQCIPILKKMNLLSVMREHTVAETGVEVVGNDDKAVAQFGVNPADKNGYALTSEYEIMRGDMIRVFYQDSLAQRARVEMEEKQSIKGSLTYEFNKSIEALHQSASSAEVTFSDGQKKDYDLVIAADGLFSRTRRLAFGRDINDAAFKSLGIHTCYFDIPRIASEGGLARMHLMPSCFFLTRTSGRPVTGAYVFTKKDSETLRASYSKPIEEQKKIWLRTMEDSDWQKERFVEGLKTCDNFYAHEQGQVKMDEFYKGRVALVGDSGYCPAPFTGLGTTCALIGCYVLAGELARHGDDVDTALKNYQKLMKPPIEELQHLPWLPFPASRMGVWIATSIAKWIYKLGIDKMLPDRGTEGGTKWALPEYPEMTFHTE